MILKEIQDETVMKCLGNRSASVAVALGFDGSNHGRVVMRRRGVRWLGVLCRVVGRLSGRGLVLLLRCMLWWGSVRRRGVFCRVCRLGGGRVILVLFLRGMMFLLLRRVVGWLGVVRVHLFLGGVVLLFLRSMMGWLRMVWVMLLFLGGVVFLLFRSVVSGLRLVVVFLLCGVMLLLL